MEKAIKIISEAQAAGLFSSYAVDKMYANTPVRVLRPEYLAAIMVQTSRSKDKERLIRFLQEASLDLPLFNSILAKYGLKQSFDQLTR